MKINRRSAIWLYLLIPSLFLVVGSFLHYQRGDYYSGLETIRSEGADDAYISYRYGWNLAHYGILSWNESGYRSHRLRLY